MEYFHFSAQRFQKSSAGTISNFFERTYMQLLWRRNLQNNKRITTHEDQGCCVNEPTNRFGNMFMM